MAAIILRRLFKNNIINKSRSNKYIYRNNSNVISSALPDIEVPDTTIPEYVYQRFNRYPDKVAVECAVTGKKYTFEEIRKYAGNLNRALRKKLRLQKGNVVAVMLPNVPEYPISVLGTLEAALTVTTLNPLYTPEEIKRQLVDSDAKALITLGAFWPIASSAVKLLSDKIPILTIKTQESEQLPRGAINFKEFIDTECDIEDVSGQSIDDIALLPYSSGTTGLPKGVQLLQRNILANIIQFDQSDIRIAISTSDNHQDVVPGLLPWFHIYGITVTLLNHIYHLAKVISLPKFTPELYVNTLVKYKPHILFVVPPIALFISGHPSIKHEYLQSVRTIVSGAAPLGKLDEEQLLKKAGKHIDILQGYGLTETSPGVLMTVPKRKKELNSNGSVGEPLSSTSIKIVPIDNPKGEALGPNEPGEILIKGPQVMKGYHNNAKETEAIFVDDGWMRTGDVAYYDANKMFYITDRLKELIKVKGYQVAPAELEELIRSHPDINDVAVIGVPNNKYGEVPRAYVVSKPNCKLNEAKLMEYVAKQVVNYKQLKGGIAIVDSIPKTASGKIMRKELKLQYQNEIK